jgi:hypothetical protein
MGFIWAADDEVSAPTAKSAEAAPAQLASALVPRQPHVPRHARPPRLTRGRRALLQLVHRQPVRPAPGGPGATG